MTVTGDIWTWATCGQLKRIATTDIESDDLYVSDAIQTLLDQGEEITYTPPGGTPLIVLARCELEEQDERAYDDGRGRKYHCRFWAIQSTDPEVGIPAFTIHGLISWNGATWSIENIMPRELAMIGASAYTYEQHDRSQRGYRRER